MSYQKILFTVSDSIARITLNRPDKRNALDLDLISELKRAFSEAEARVEAVAVLLRGAGKDFSAGMDLSVLQRIQQLDVLENIEDAESLVQLFVQMRRMRKPIVAAVHGRALAGGCGLATACDIILASQSAELAYTETRIGFVPAIVSSLARRAVGEKKAFELLVRAGPLSAEEAAQVGLINQVFADDAFDNGIEDYLALFRKLSSSAMGLTKSLLYATDGMTWEQAMRAAVDVNTLARMTEDCKKGIAVFLEKKNKR